jgi:hypothetical protein
MRAKRISGGSVVLVLVLAGFLGACSSDDADDDAGTEAGTTDDSTVPSGAQAGPLDEPLEAYAGEESEVYADPASWLCRPDTTDDVCDQDLDLTVVEADGTTSVDAFEPVADAPVDCFYVYPTISRDETTNSDMDASPEEEGFAALNQVARLGETCRVFAPVYRQTTLTALSGAVSGGGGLPAEAGEMAYGDVLDAWEHYLATDNEGRGVILVGHSQGFRRGAPVRGERPGGLRGVVGVVPGDGPTAGRRVLRSQPLVRRARRLHQPCRSGRWHRRRGRRPRFRVLGRARGGDPRLPRRRR